MKNRGYTLVEALIYLVILAFLSYAVVSSLLVMRQSFFAVRRTQSLQEAGTVVMERLVREIRLATSTNVVASTFNSSPGKLGLNSADSSDNPALVQFVLSNPAAVLGVSSQIVTLQIGDALAENLHPDYINATNLVFRLINTSHSQAVKIELTLADLRAGPVLSGEFYGTAVLRSSY